MIKRFSLFFLVLVSFNTPISAQKIHYDSELRILAILKILEEPSLSVTRPIEGILGRIPNRVKRNWSLNDELNNLISPETQGDLRPPSRQFLLSLLHDRNYHNVNFRRLIKTLALLEDDRINEITFSFAMRNTDETQVYPNNEMENYRNWGNNENLKTDVLDFFVKNGILLNRVKRQLISDKNTDMSYLGFIDAEIDCLIIESMISILENPHPKERPPVDNHTFQKPGFTLDLYKVRSDSRHYLNSFESSSIDSNNIDMSKWINNDKLAIIDLKKIKNSLIRMKARAPLKRTIATYRNNKIKKELHAIRNAVLSYQLKFGAYPEKLGELREVDYKGSVNRYVLKFENSRPKIYGYGYVTYIMDVERNVYSDTYNSKYSSPNVTSEYEIIQQWARDTSIENTRDFPKSSTCNATSMDLYPIE